MSKYTRKQVIKMLTDGESLAGVNLSGLDLSNENFASKDWGESGRCEELADFRGATLNDVKFCKSDLRSANFCGAKLHNTDFTNSDLTDAYFVGADLLRACFKSNKKCLEGTNFTEANLIEADLSAVDLSQAVLNATNFFKANLSWVKFNETTVEDPNRMDTLRSIHEPLVEEDLGGTKTIPIERRKIIANFTEANLKEADFSLTDLVECKFTRAILSMANFFMADLYKTDLKNTNLSFVNFESAILKRADISGANIYRINMANCLLDNIVCTHIYECDNYRWNNLEQLEEYCVDNLNYGDFEKFIKSLPTLKKMFSNHYLFLPYMKLFKKGFQPKSFNDGIKSTIDDDNILQKIYDVWTIDGKSEATIEEFNDYKNTKDLFVKGDTQRVYKKGNLITGFKAQDYKILAYLLEHEGCAYPKKLYNFLWKKRLNPNLEIGEAKKAVSPPISRLRNVLRKHYEDYPECEDRIFSPLEWENSRYCLHSSIDFMLGQRKSNIEQLNKG